MHGELDRRRFLRSTLAVCGSLAWFAGTSSAAELAPRAASRGTTPPGAPPRALLIVELHGGNDGLNTIVPFEDPLYAQARPRIALARESVLPFAERRAFHPRLTGLHKLFGESRVALVEGVGYATPNRSHFSSQDIWYTARREGRASGAGWVGRLIAELYPDEREIAHAVHVGAGLPYSLTSPTHPVVYLEIPSAFRYATDAGAIRGALDAAPADDTSPALARVRAASRSAQRASQVLRSAVGTYAPRAVYPATQLGQDLRNAAAILSAQLGARVVSVRHDGYDFHDDHLRRQDVLLGELDAALSSFLEDLRGTPLGENTLVLVVSEFGRRVADNASQGTDHGTAGPVLLLGGALRGGLYGAPCSLATLDQGDLIFTTDFRSVYATLLERWFGIEQEKVLGATYPKLDFLA